MVNVIIDPSPYDAELPPLPIGALVIGTADLLRQACDLPQPCALTVRNSQLIELHFDGNAAGIAAVNRWALRFGGLLERKPCNGIYGPFDLHQVIFDFYGVTVEAYTVIRPEVATT